MDAVLIKAILGYNQYGNVLVAYNTSRCQHNDLVECCFTGVSFSDHEVLYQHLVIRLETEVTPHIVILRSHDCCLG